MCIANVSVQDFDYSAIDSIIGMLARIQVCVVDYDECIDGTNQYVDGAVFDSVHISVA